MNTPQVILRLGSHAEKEYFEKLAKGLDGLMFGANLLEITPAATCSLVFSLRNKRAGNTLPYYLDPMTYCFGAYVDSGTGQTRTDLDALKSDRQENRKSKKVVRSVKDSYVSLAKCLGGPFRAAINDGRACTAINPAALSNADKDSICQAVADYQLTRLDSILREDAFMRSQFANDGRPAAVFAPYFYIHERWARDGLASCLEFASRTVSLGLDLPTHVIVCANDSLLGMRSVGDILIKELPKTGAKAAWLWFDGFEKFAATTEQLREFRRIVTALAGQMEVYNLHGGFYSLLLCHDGMTGISHGVGYGEQKAVQQVIGAAAPTVRYYLPPIHKRVGIPEIQRCLGDVGIKSAQDYLDRVCNCTICKGVMRSSLVELRAFGEMHRATGDSKRDTQTPTAAKICRYHFLLNRLREPAEVAALSRSERADYLMNVAAPWRKCPAMQASLNVDADGSSYLERWATALS